MMTYRHGIDNLSSVDALLQGKRLGLITNPTGLSSDFRSDIEILHERYDLCRLYAPEHGVRGDKQAGAHVGDEVDEATGVPVISMFGHDGKMALDGIDCVLYDIQDVGLRFYTYIYVLEKAMRACAEAKIPLVVLDRADPLGLSVVRGTMIDSRFDSGVGGCGLPSRYGMTSAEFARYINGEYHIGCELYASPCMGLTRGMLFPDTGTPWVQPSPNIPTFDSAVCYEGTVYFEGTNVSEGRGTTRPFEMIGAPWMKNDVVAEALRAEHFPGVLIRPVYFTPTFSKYAGELCRGVQLHVTDPAAYDGFTVGLFLLQTIRELHPDDFRFLGEKTFFIDHLAGNDLIRRGLYDAEQKKRDAEALTLFERRTEKYHLYS